MLVLSTRLLGRSGDNRERVSIGRSSLIEKFKNHRFFLSRLKDATAAHSALNTIDNH